MCCLGFDNLGCAAASSVRAAAVGARPQWRCPASLIALHLKFCPALDASSFSSARLSMHWLFVVSSTAMQNSCSDLLYCNAVCNDGYFPCGTVCCNGAPLNSPASFISFLRCQASSLLVTPGVAVCFKCVLGKPSSLFMKLT